jgi:hypothetical protein
MVLVACSPAGSNLVKTLKKEGGFESLVFGGSRSVHTPSSAREYSPSGFSDPGDSYHFDHSYNGSSLFGSGITPSTMKSLPTRRPFSSSVVADRNRPTTPLEALTAVSPPDDSTSGLARPVPTRMQLVLPTASDAPAPSDFPTPNIDVSVFTDEEGEDHHHHAGAGAGTRTDHGEPRRNMSPAPAEVGYSRPYDTLHTDHANSALAADEESKTVSGADKLPDLEAVEDAEASDRPRSYPRKQSVFRKIKQAVTNIHPPEVDEHTKEIGNQVKGTGKELWHHARVALT